MIDFRAYQNTISEHEFYLFRDYIQSICGITLIPEKAYLLETRLTKLMIDTGTDTFEAFYHYIETHPHSSIKQKIINAITTNETLWFRDSLPWRVMEEVIIPSFIDDLRTHRKPKIRIWFAASSTGQEAYSTVMCIHHYLAHHHIKDIGLSDFEFLATDISSTVLDIAKKGRYDAISIMRGLSPEYKLQYFDQDGTAWVIHPYIREVVTFDSFNLMSPFYPIASYDVIFCRYVLIYFSDEIKRDIIVKLNRAMVNNGTLFIGNYTLLDMFNDHFVTKQYDNLTYYVKGC